MSEQSLKDKTVKGVAWSGIDNVAQFGVTFIVGIVLARLLSPEDYGLIGVVGIFTAICQALINGGFGNALIRKVDVTNDDYNTSFVINLGMSILLYIIIFLCSPFIAFFFNRQELVSLTRVSSLGMIVGAFAIVQHTRLTKELNFKAQTKITVIASVFSGIVGVVMALLGCGVWSLVAQNLTSQVLRTVLLWMANKWTPNLSFSKTSFTDLFGFGWKIMLSNLLDTLWKELYQVVVGKFYSPAVLGQYTRSKHFASLFSSNLTTIVQRVTYPVLSTIQDNQSRMIAAYRRIIKVTMFITAICMFSLGAISEPLIYCLIGPKWHDAATYLPFICISMSLYPLHALNLNMLQVQGRSDLFLALEIIKKIIALCPLYIGATIGIVPMLQTNIVISIICFFINSYYSGKLLGYSSWMQLKDIAPSYGIAISIAIPVYFLKFLPLPFFVTLPIQIAVGVGVFFIVCNYVRGEEYTEVVNMVRPLVKQLTQNKNDR